MPDIHKKTTVLKRCNSNTRSTAPANCNSKFPYSQPETIELVHCRCRTQRRLCPGTKTHVGRHIFFDMYEDTLALGKNSLCRFDHTICKTGVTRHFDPIRLFSRKHNIGMVKGYPYTAIYSADLCIQIYQ